MVGEDGRPDMLNGEQIWKNCGNMGTNRNFGTRDQGRTTLKVECSSGNRLVIGEDLVLHMDSNTRGKHLKLGKKFLIF